MNVQTFFVQAFVLFLAYFSPIKGFIHAVVFLWLVDWIFGVWKARKRKQRLTSYKFRKTISKITGYLACIVVTYIFEREMMWDSLYITRVIAAYIAWTELLSIYENIAVITGKEFIKDLSIVVWDNMKTKFKLPKK